MCSLKVVHSETKPACKQTQIMVLKCWQTKLFLVKVQKAPRKMLIFKLNIQITLNIDTYLKTMEHYYKKMHTKRNMDG